MTVMTEATKLKSKICTATPPAQQIFNHIENDSCWKWTSNEEYGGMKLQYAFTHAGSNFLVLDMKAIVGRNEIQSFLRVSDKADILCARARARACSCAFVFVFVVCVWERGDGGGSGGGWVGGWVVVCCVTR